MPAAIAIPAIMGASAVGGGLMQRSAARNASRAQENAALGAGQQYRDLLERLAPGFVTQADQGAAGVEQAGEFAGANVDQAADRGVDRMGMANGLLSMLYGDMRGSLNPYQDAGREGVDAMRRMIGEQQAPAEFSFSQDDPSYQFRMDQAMKALERSRAARGLLNSGGTASALTTLASNLASTEYGRAFDRYQQSRTQNRNDMLARFGMASDVAGMGQTANAQQLAAGSAYGAGVSDNLGRASQIDLQGRTTSGGMRLGSAQFGAETRNRGLENMLGMQATGGRYEADAIMGAGDARAAGHIGAGNAWAGMFGGLGNAAGTAWGMRQFERQNPTPPRTSPGPYRGMGGFY